MLTDTPQQPKQGAAAGEAWRAQLAGAYRNPRALIAELALPEALVEPAERAAEAFPLRVPPSYVSRMQRGDPDDPLLRQVLPLGAELDAAPGYTADPLAEQPRRAGPGLLEKYPGRALILATGGCAVHCRYCFRRGAPHAAEPGWRRALEHLERHGAPEEVILSGGDPLLLDDAALGEALERLARVPGVRRVRIHTRLPVAIPERVTPVLRDRLAASPLPVVVVVHANHPQEVDAATAAALAALGRSAHTALNQAVLLRGVNDSVPALAGLSERLFDAGVLPYYLHLPDPAAGTAHFDVDAETARALAAALAAHLPGYLVPRLAREEPGAGAKTVLSPTGP